MTIEPPSEPTSNDPAPRQPGDQEAAALPENIDEVSRSSHQQSQDALAGPETHTTTEGAMLDQDDFNESMRFLVRRFPHWFSRVCRDKLEPEKFPEDQVILDELSRGEEIGKRKRDDAKH